MRVFQLWDALPTVASSTGQLVSSLMTASGLEVNP